MKLITFKYQGKEQVGVMTKNDTQVVALERFGMQAVTMLELIRDTADDSWATVKEKAETLEGISYNAVEKCAPIPRPWQDIICLGINYMEHAKESAKFDNKEFSGERPHAVYFSKRVNEAVADGEDIDGHSDMVKDLDYEVELALVIGKDAKKVSLEDAYDYVFGYTIMNDVSARLIQRRHGQWYYGKSLDGFTPMGPWIVTADEFDKPPVLHIESRINGEVRQSSCTDKLIFSIAHVIHELSQGMTLKAGSIISMGTPSGVGMGFDPPKYLKAGDVVVCEIEGIGRLTNAVK